MQVEDPYIWMENLQDPRVLEFVEKENKKLREFLGDLPDKLYPRISRYYMTEYVVMVRVSDKGYFGLFREGNSYKIKLMTKKGEWRELIDSQSLGKDYIIRYFYTSPDGEILAYTYSYGGADEGVTKFVKVDTMETIDEIKGVIGSIVWLNHEKFYYVKMFRKEKTPDGVPPPATRVFLRENGIDEMVYGQGLPPAYFIGLAKSNFSDQALVTISYGWTESSVHRGPLRDPSKWEKIYEGKGFPVYPIEYVNNQYLVISFEKNMGVLLSISDNQEKKILVDEWEFPLQNAVVVNDRILIHYLRHASSVIRAFDLSGTLIDTVISDVPGTISSLHSNGSEAVFKFESFWIPYRIYTYRDKIKLITSNEIENDYTVEEDFTESRDGTKIHLFIVKRKGTEIRDVLIFGYGGFRIAITPTYVPHVLPFIDDGGIYAVANIRGGTEYGEEWHRLGMRENKQNVFDDFIAAIEYFKNKGSRVIASGRSNGGLLVGAVLTQRPEILDGALIGYPVLDMLRFHKLYIGKAWVPEYGDPDNPRDAEFLRKYSPYHNISKDKKYPPTLVYTGLHDDRVHPAHAFKFVAKLEEVGAPVYLRVETASGHAGATPEIKIKEYSDLLAFVYKVLEKKV